MSDKLIVVRAAWDDEAKVWYVEDSDVFGVNAEAETLEALRDKLPAVISDVLADNEPARLRDDTAVEIIAHAHTRVLVRA
jgi:hypothetical protein